MAKANVNTYLISKEILSYSIEIMEKIGSFKFDGTEKAIRLKVGDREIKNIGFSDFEKELVKRVDRKSAPASLKVVFSWAKKGKSGSPLLSAPVLMYQIIESSKLEEKDFDIAIDPALSILSSFREIFAYLDIKERLLNNIEKLKEAMNKTNEVNSLTPFITFFLLELLNSLNSGRDSVTGFEGRKSPCVRKLLDLMRLGNEYSSKELMIKLGLKSRVAVKRNYLEPALKDGYIEMLLPNKPHSPNQRYRKLPSRIEK